ncbi:hypothetical protein GUITHDRAFT_51279, partial [Guillardia theta CCMP2712]
RKFHPSTIRWPLIHQFFSLHPDKYKRVLMADVRDTAFQGDPFEILKDSSSSFLAFTGVQDRTIGQCGWNGGWVRDCFGPEMFSRLSSKPIICSGISMGTMDAVKSYLQAMSEHIMKQEFAACERNGVDQGVHNVLVHTDKIPHLRVNRQDDGLVANMQAHVMKFRSGKVYNVNNELARVVHQYDRDLELQRSLLDSYVDFEWHKE